MPDNAPPIVTVSLNTAVDRTLEVPGLEWGGHVRGRLVSIQPAGKAVNVARLLATLGAPSVLTGFVGEGDRPRFESSFAKTGVRVELFEGRGTTRENITLIDPERGLETHVRDAGFALSAEDLERLTKKLGILAVRDSYVIFAGSLPPEMDARTFRRLIRVCLDGGAHVAVDSSGAGLAAVAGTEGVWMVKPNREELAELAGRPVEDEAAIREAAEALGDRIEETVVTGGAEGACLFARDGAWRARPDVDPGSVVNTVGCGDALLAGFVKARAEGLAPEECLRWGVATGAAATRQVRAGVVDPDEVPALLKHVEVTAL